MSEPEEIGRVIDSDGRVAVAGIQDGMLTVSSDPVSLAPVLRFTAQTREARADAVAAEDAEREHRRGCIACIRAVRKRSDGERCGLGKKLIEAKRETAAALREERRLDKLPMDGQEPLFADDELAVSGRQELTP